MPPFVQGLGCLARAAGTLLARPRRADADDRAASFFRFTAQSLDKQAPGRIIDTLVQARLGGGPVGGVHRLSGLFRLTFIQRLLWTPRHSPTLEHFNGDQAEAGDERTGKAPLEEGALVTNPRVPPRGGTREDMCAPCGCPCGTLLAALGHPHLNRGRGWNWLTCGFCCSRCECRRSSAQRCRVKLHHLQCLYFSQ